MHKVRKETQERPEPQVLRVIQGQLVRLVQQERPAQPELKAHRAKLVQLVQQGPRARKVPKVTLA